MGPYKLTKSRLNKYIEFLEDGYRRGAAARAVGVTPKAVREYACLLYTSPSPRDRQKSRMPSSA